LSAKFAQQRLEGDLSEQIRLAAERIILEDADHKTTVVLIDGHAGSGKSMIAQALREEIFKTTLDAPTLIHMDDLYPGWEGLRAGSLYLIREILEPLSRSQRATWQVWDWERSSRGRPGEAGNGFRESAGGNIVIVEGCGSLSKRAKELAALGIWIDADAERRAIRLKDRDGDRFAVEMALWATQETEFYNDEASRDLADLVLTN